MAGIQLGGAASGASGGCMGNVSCVNAFKVLFSNALSAQPRLEAWDDAADMVAKTAPSDEILAGTASSGNNSWLAGADTSAGSNPGTGWYPSAENSGGTTPSLLCGSKGYVLLDHATVLVASRTFNIALKVPSDAAQSGTTQHTPVISIRYYYTGDEPGVEWQFNKGAEASPDWATAVAGSQGDTLHFTGPDASATFFDPFTKPDTLTEVDEYWIDT